MDAGPGARREATAGETVVGRQHGSTRPVESDSSSVQLPWWVRPRDQQAGAVGAMKEMERAFGQPFGSVRLAADPAAQQAARAEHAFAFTRIDQGEQISFGPGAFDPGSRAGSFTLAHELAHVIQLRAGAQPDAGPDVRERLEQQADRAAADVLAGSRPDVGPMPATRGGQSTDDPAATPAAGLKGTPPLRPAVLRQDSPGSAPSGSEPPAEAVVWTMGLDEAQRTALRILQADRPDVAADRIGVFFFVGHTIRLYRGGVLRATARLAEDAAQAPAGFFRPGPNGTAQQLFRRTYPDGHETTEWLGVGADDPLHRTLDKIVPEDEQAYLAEVRQSLSHLWIRLQSRGTTADSGSGEAPVTEVDGGGEGGGDAAPSLPSWAIALHNGLVARLNSEQRRIAELARRTLGDQRPESLLRLFAIQGVPQRLSLGRLDRPASSGAVAPAEQVTVNRRAPGEARSGSASGTLPLQQHDTVDVAWERVLTAARLLYANRPDSARIDPARDVASEAPIGLPGTEPPDPDHVPANAPAYPSSIRNWGPDTAVVGASHSFTMQLDWSIDDVAGGWALAGPMALRRYDWRVYKINDPAPEGGSGGAEVDPQAAGNSRRVGRGEGAGLVWHRGFDGIWEDLESSTAEEVVDGSALIAIDVGLRSIGTVVRSFVALVGEPSNERAMAFSGPGTYVVLCATAQVPVTRTEDNPHPFVRAPSVALYPIQAETAAHLAQASVAPHEVTAAQAELIWASADLEQASDADRERLAQVVSDATTRVTRLQVADQLDLPSYLTSTIAAREGDIRMLNQVIELQSSGRPLDDWPDDVRLLRAGLIIAQVEPRLALQQATAHRDQLLVQQRSLGEVSGLKGESYRPHLSFVPDADGRILPVTAMLAEAQDSTATRAHWVLVDLSVAGHRDRYQGWSSRTGPAGAAAAIRGALDDFAGTVPYGRGLIGIRLPESLQERLQGEQVPDHLRAHPDVTARTWQRLESLAVAAGVAALVVSGPVGVALGVVGGIAGGAVAAHNLSRRVSGGYFEWDLQTVLDITAIIGAALPGVGGLAGSVRAGSRLVPVADWVEQGIKIYGYVQLAGTFVVIPLSLVEQVAAIKARTDLSPGQAAALQAESFIQASFQIAQLAATAAQMIGHAGGPPRTRPSAPGVEPAPRVGTPTPRTTPPGPETPRPPVQPPTPPREPTPPGTPTPAPETPVPPVRPTPAAREPTTPGQPASPDQATLVETVPPAETPPPGETPPARRPSAPPHEASSPPARQIVQEPLEHGMVMMAPEGQTLSRRVAEDFFDRAARNTREAEVALLRNDKSGDFVLVIGDDARVRLGEGNPNWQEILPERARTGTWVLEAHSHAVDPRTGFTAAEARWPSGASGDFLVVVNEATRTGRTATGRIRLHTARGEQTTTYAYHPGTSRPYEVAIALPEGGAYRQRYATVEAYYADRARVVGTPPEPVPEGFTGARQSPTRPEQGPAVPEPPTPPGEATPAAPPAPGATEPTVAVPTEPPTPGAPAAPEAAHAPRTGTASRTRQQQLAAAEAEAAEAASTGRSAEANRRLLDLQSSIRAGFEDTGMSAGQIAKLLDAGVTPAQVHALRTCLGDGAGPALARQSNTALVELGTFAEHLAPMSSDPVVQSAVARLQRPIDSQAVNPVTALQRLAPVPPDRLPTLLGVIADPLFPLWGTLTAEGRFARLYENPQVLDLVARYGSTVWELLSKGSEPALRRQTLEALARQVAEHPETADDLVDSVLEARTPRAMADAVRIPRPPRAVRPRATVAITADPSDALWSTYQSQARTFARDHPAWLAERTAPSGDPPVARPISEVHDELATLYQIQSRARRGAYGGLSHEERLTLLDNYIEALREFGWTGPARQTWTNQASGALSEALFIPEGARGQVNLPNPAGGVTRVDYLLPAEASVIAGRPNYVEQKSDELSWPNETSRVASADVAKCRSYVTDGVLDEPAITRAGGVHLIEFVRSPGNAATEIAMLDVLLAPDSPYSAARIGGGNWITKAQWPAVRAGRLATP